MKNQVTLIASILLIAFSFSNTASAAPTYRECIKAEVEKAIDTYQVAIDTQLNRLNQANSKHQENGLAVLAMVAYGEQCDLADQHAAFEANTNASAIFPNQKVHALCSAYLFNK